MNFLSKGSFHFTGKDTFKNFKVTEYQLKKLNDVLTFTLQTPMFASCLEPGRLTIMGSYIKFSDFIGIDEKVMYGYLCPHYRGSLLNSLDVFSLDTIFINRNLREIGSELQVSIIAPKWEVIGDRIIELDGATGVPHDPYKARPVSGIGYKGYDGVPGLPGGPGGNFLGIGEEFSIDLSLNISSNGGKGGPGQHGGDGSNGGNGENARVDDYFEKEFLETDLYISVYFANHATDNYMYHGKSGSAGGDGGNGGVGGMGGMAGEIKLFHFDLNPRPIFKKTNQGPDGIDGEGGVGGDGGMSGDNMYASFCKKYFGPIPHELRWCKKIPVPSNTRARSGVKGETGFVSQERKQPIKSKSQNINFIVSCYKQYVRDNSKHNFKKTMLLNFMKKLESNVTSHYTAAEPETSNTPKSARRQRRHQHRREPHYHPNVSSSAQQPTSWIGYLWKGLFQAFLTDTRASLPNPPTSLTPSAYNAGHLQGGLQLLDLAIRKWTGEKYTQPTSAINFVADDNRRTMACQLAYGTQCPALATMEQSFATEFDKPPTKIQAPCLVSNTENKFPPSSTSAELSSHPPATIELSSG